MKQIRAVRGAALAALFLLASIPDAAAGMSRECRLARKHFKDGVWHFESDQWDQAMRHFLASISQAGSCDPDDMRFIVPYGRWRYRFTPEVYLGVALSESTSCSGESVSDLECRLGDSVWRRLDASDLACLRSIESANCAGLDSASSARCGPEVDWLLELEGRQVRMRLDPGGGPASDPAREGGSHRLMVSGYAADERSMDDDCDELWGLVPFLREAILRRANRKREICGELLEEVRSLLSGARRLCDSRWAG